MKIAVEWKEQKPEGKIELSGCTLKGLSIIHGEGTAEKGSFTFSGGDRCRLEADIEKTDGNDKAIVTLRTGDNSFSFYLDNVNSECPIIIPAYFAAVTSGDDARSYDEILNDIEAKGLKTAIETFEEEDEETYENAAAHTRDQHGPTWLGLARDMRIFELDFQMDSSNSTTNRVSPKYHGTAHRIPEGEDKPLHYNFVIGRGVGCREDIKRELEEKVLPIVHAVISDDDIVYNTTSFVTLEKSVLKKENVRGTHFLTADGYSSGHMFTKEQQEKFDALKKEETEREEETLFCFRAEALNNGSVPRYAWFKAPEIYRIPSSFDKENGFSLYSEDRVNAVSLLKGKPLNEEETAVLLKPGESVRFEFYIPHSPLSAARASALQKLDFDGLKKECCEYWEEKLSHAASFGIPETRIAEMVKAGILHLDLVTYGHEPEGTLTATIGVYAAIGSESAPIIQFYDSAGLHDIARRSIMYFFDKQHDDGFIQNFGDYMLETGAALWSAGEHYRYTRDKEWVASVLPKIIKSADYVIDWRDKNKKDDLKGRGYGMIDGKCADPEDPFHAYMLNGYAYLGLARTAEMLKALGDERFELYEKTADAFKADIRESFFESMAVAPVVPLGDGTWCPAPAPWPESRGAVSLHAEEGNCFTHGTVMGRDSLLGPLYLVYQEVIDPKEDAGEFLLNSHAELMCMRNVGLSQPYYCRQPYVHLKRGEVKPFLKSYYNGFAGLADRETFSFWEHYFHASPHKTHEEGWFLMQTRWMLWMEEGNTLRVFPGIPRAWLESGRSINLKDIATYFGHADIKVDSEADKGFIEAEIVFHGEEAPKQIELRIPHPEGKKAKSVSVGTYNADKETVVIESGGKSIKVKLEF